VKTSTGLFAGDGTTPHFAGDDTIEIETDLNDHGSSFRRITCQLDDQC
jgi:hypothetical protein